MKAKKSVRRKMSDSREPNRKDPRSPRKAGDRPGKGLDKSTEAVVQSRSARAPARRV